MSGPLAGIRIVELTSVVLGPWACQILGDLGADIIKVEPPHGDSNRQLGPARNPQMCALYLTCNRNKRSVVLDLKQEAGRSALLRLVEGADVVVHNFRAQAMERLRLTYEDLKAVNPQIIYCATYGYGKAGPYGDKAALDDSIQAAAGVAMLQQMVLGEPRYLPTVVSDKTTSLAVVYAVMAALFHRERHGVGQQIEVPMFETMVSFVMAEHLYGMTFEPAIGGPGYTRLMSENRRPYKTRDGYIAVLPYMDSHWRTFCELAGRHELLEDERFATLSSRLANIDETYREVAETIATRTTGEWLEILGESCVPTMVVNSLEDLPADPHLNATGFWQLVDHPTEGRLRMPGLPVAFSESPGSIRLLPPRLGEHSIEVLRETGLSPDEIDAMLESGATRVPVDTQEELAE
jgi:crotonobetainyl-CoA:carnitine CoA-transferase CaiB-like acyl-CoA transferase